MRDCAHVEYDDSTDRVDQAADRPQEGRLTGSVGAEQRDDLALMDVEVHTEQDLQVAAVRDLETSYGEHGVDVRGRLRLPRLDDVSSHELARSQFHQSCA